MSSTEVDSPYSWIVAGSCFFLYMMMYGAYRLSGIMFVASMPRFGVGREAASFPYTFAGFTKNVAGPLVGILVHKFRIRTLILFGCSLSGLGIGACFFAENIFTVSVLWGVVYGFGFALACALLPVLINQHFVKHRATAAGIAFSGMCVGSMIFPPLVEICIDFYGISGTFLIISGLVLNCVPFAIFLRERTVSKETGKKATTKQRDKKQKKVSFSTTENTPLLASSGQLQKNVLPYLSIPEAKTRTVSENQCIVESDLESNMAEGKNISADHKYQSVIVTCNDMDKKQIRNQYEGILTSYISSTVPTITTSSIEDSLEKQLRTNQQNLSMSDSLIKNGDLSESQIVSKSTEFKEKNNFNVSNNESSQKNNSNTTNYSNEQIVSEEVSVTSDIPDFGSNETFSKDNIRQNIYSKSNVKNAEDPEARARTKSVSSISDNFGGDGLRNDTTFIIVSEDSALIKRAPNTGKKSNASSDSICRGNCSLVLSFTYIVILITKTLSNSIALCVNTVIFDYSRDIGISEENEKYILIFSSMGELLGRLCLGRITDSHCLSKSMFMVVCSVGQGLGALCIAWSTGFIELSAGLFVYAFMGSVVQFMCPLVIADGIEEDKQAFAITSSSFLAGPASLAISPLIGYLRDEIGTYTYLFYGISVLCGLTGILWLFGYFFMKPKPSYVKIK